MEGKVAMLEGVEVILEGIKNNTLSIVEAKLQLNYFAKYIFIDLFGYAIPSKRPKTGVLCLKWKLYWRVGNFCRLFKWKLYWSLSNIVEVI